MKLKDYILNEYLSEAEHQHYLQMSDAEKYKYLQKKINLFLADLNTSDFNKENEKFLKARK